MKDTTEALLRSRLYGYSAAVPDDFKKGEPIGLSDSQVDFFIELFWWALKREEEL